MVSDELLRLPSGFFRIPSIWDLIIVMAKVLSLYFCLSFLVAIPLRTRWKVLRSARVSAYIALLGFGALWLFGEVAGVSGGGLMEALWLYMLFILIFGVGLVLFFLALISKIFHREIFVGWRLFILSISTAAIAYTLITGFRVRDRSECGHDVTCHGIVFQGKCLGYEKHHYSTCSQCSGDEDCFPDYAL